MIKNADGVEFIKKEKYDKLQSELDKAKAENKKLQMPRLELIDQLQADLEQCKVAMALNKPCNVAFERENIQLQKALSRAIELLEDVYSGGFYDHLKAEIEKLKALKIRC